MAKKTVLVTGGGAGIGADIAKRFGEAGYSVAVFDLDLAAARDITKEIESTSEALAIGGDVSSEKDAREGVETTVRKFGSVDVLINNAGIEINGSVQELTAAAWDRQMAVNLRGAFLFSKYAIEEMSGKGGAIINVASVHAFVSWPGCAAYDTTKAGLLALTRAMALDHGPAGIRVNAICPGYIDTPLMERWLESVPDRKETERQVLACHPLGRIGTSRDVAEAALFLASEAASFISGASLVVDGAMSIAGH